MFLIVGANCQNWPGWRGENRDAKVEGFTVPDVWPGMLTQVWQEKVGLGDASISFVAGMLYLNVKQDADEVALCVDDVDVVAAKFSRLFDLRPNFPMADVALFKLSEGKVYIVNLAALAKWAPGVVPPAVPSVFGVGFSV